MPRFIKTLAAAALLLALAGATLACGDAHSDRQPAPGFELADASGHMVKLSDYRGQVVLVNFWATWCRVCKMELPWLVQFQKQYGPKGFAVLGVSLDDGGWAVVTPFVASQQLPYRILLGDTFTAREYGISNIMPNSFLIDKKGRVAMGVQGIVDRDATEAQINALLAGR